MLNTKRIRLALTIVIALCLLAPTVSARRKVHVRVYTVPGPDFLVYDHSEAMPNGYMKVDVCYNFSWLDSDFNYLGYALQYVEGIAKMDSGNDFSILSGYGVFHSADNTKPGTITYTIGNNWAAPATFWAARLKIDEGTGHFEGVKGQGELNFDLFAFELYLDYDPWG